HHLGWGMVPAHHHGPQGPDVAPEGREPGGLEHLLDLLQLDVLVRTQVPERAARPDGFLQLHRYLPTLVRAASRSQVPSTTPRCLSSRLRTRKVSVFGSSSRSST